MVVVAAVLENSAAGVMVVVESVNATVAGGPAAATDIEIATPALVLVSRIPVSPPATAPSPTAAAVVKLAVTPGLPSLLISEISAPTVVAVVVSVLVVPSGLVIVKIRLPAIASVC